ncbi:MAG: peroxiredoxin family protein, partial [Phaeodactylibacter sp.]|nr:peroxiredoxin family protein [Phaeodactylibacter sp.]
GYLAFMNGDVEKAKKAMLKNTPGHLRMMYQFKYEDFKEAESAARKQIDKKDKQTLPLAQAIYVLHQIKKDDPAVRKGFEELRSISSEIELESPIFARLAPIAKHLGYPKDWRLPYEMPKDIKSYADQDKLGPLHWTPAAAPSFALFDQHRKQISLEQYKGKPCILVFYLGAGCLHCTEQLTAMADQYEDFKKAGLPILAISTDDVSKLKKSQDNYSKGDIPFPIVSNAKKDMFKKYTAYDDFEDQPLHGTFVLNAKGSILWSDISADPFMELDFLIKEANRLIALHP